MKIEAEVFGVETDGQDIKLTLKGWPTTAPAGSARTAYQIEVPATAKAKRAFYIGRKVNVTIDPQ